MASRAGGLDLLVVGSEPVQALAGGSHWWRVAPRTRLGGLLVAGAAGGEAAARGELAGHFLLHPERVGGTGLYLGGGLAVSRGKSRGEQLVVLVGLEGSPGASGGWVLEVGLGGGVRVAAGWRWRANGVRR